VRRCFALFRGVYGAAETGSRTASVGGRGLSITKPPRTVEWSRAGSVQARRGERTDGRVGAHGLTAYTNDLRVILIQRVRRHGNAARHRNCPSFPSLFACGRLGVILIRKRRTARRLRGEGRGKAGSTVLGRQGGGLGWAVSGALGPTRQRDIYATLLRKVRRVQASLSAK